MASIIPQQNTAVYVLNSNTGLGVSLQSIFMPSVYYFPFISLFFPHPSDAFIFDSRETILSHFYFADKFFSFNGESGITTKEMNDGFYFNSFSLSLFLFHSKTEC
jgi:hypothetical protein